MQKELVDPEEFDEKPTSNTKSESKSVFEQQEEFLTRKYGPDWRDNPRSNSKKRRKKRRRTRR